MIIRTGGYLSEILTLALEFFLPKTKPDPERVVKGYCSILIILRQMFRK